MMKLKLVPILFLTIISAMLGCSDSGDDTPTGGGAVTTITVADVTVAEGNTATFVVSLSQSSASSITFNFATATGTADSTDFVSKTGTRTIAIGATSTTITVSTVDDTDVEPSEAFSLILSGANVMFTGNDSVTACTITDNDSAPSVQVDDVSINEGDTALFSISLSIVQSSDVTVYYSTMDSSAIAPGDYIARSTMSIITAGNSSLSVSVVSVEDADVEPNEQFLLVIDSASVQVLDSTGLCTILNDDVVLVSYASDIKSIIDSIGCTAAGTCHGGSPPGGGMSLPNSNHSTVVNATGNNGSFIVPSFADSSNFFIKVSPSPFGGQMPPGGPFLSTQQQNLIRDWINQGALDN